MRMTKHIHQADRGAIHYWRVEMRGSKGVLAAMVGVSDQFMRDDPDVARSHVAGELIEVRRDIRKVYKTTSPPWASRK